MMKSAANLAAMILLVAATGPAGQGAENHFTGTAGDDWIARTDANGSIDYGVDDDDLSVVLSHFGQCGVTWSEGDLDGDGCVDDEDLSLLLCGWDIVEPMWGDANRDGFVNDDDLSIVLSHFGQCGVGWPEGDFSGDGCVDDDDLNPILIPFPPVSPVMAGGPIPEPASLATLLLGSLTLAHRKRRPS